MKKTTKIAVIGAGRIGQWHIDHLSSRVALAEVVAVVDVRELAAKEAAKKYDIPHALTSIQEAIDKTHPDAFIVASSTDTHEEAIRMASNHGIHVFCEKPLSNTIESVKRIRDMVRRSGIKLQVGFNRRFDKSFARVENSIKEHEIGDFHSLRIISRDPSPPPIEYVKRSGGIFMDMMIHDFDMVRFLVKKEPVEIYAMGSCLIDPCIEEAGDIDTALVTSKFYNSLLHSKFRLYRHYFCAITVKFKDGSFATIENSRKAAYGYDQRAEAFGSEGSISTDNMFPNTATVATSKGISKDLPLHFFKDRYEEACISELVSFLDKIQKGAKPVVDEVDGSEAVFLAFAAQRSIEKQTPINLEDLRRELHFPQETEENMDHTEALRSIEQTDPKNTEELRSEQDVPQANEENVQVLTVTQ